MRLNFNTLLKKWREVRDSSSFSNLMLYLVFVAVSALFWIILALNDSAQDSFNVRVAITNCPDSVTFISDIPQDIHVSVRDRGTTLFRTKFRRPTLNINFNDVSNNGIVKISKNEMLTGIKSIFGAGAQIVSMSLDSMYLEYTTNKGKRVPVEVVGAVYPAIGTTIEGTLKSIPGSVLVYGERGVTDTIHKVRTTPLELHDLIETTEVEVGIKKIKDVRIMPSSVKVKIPIETLVKKSALVTLSPVNVPRGETLLLFPSKVKVEYYVAMSRFNDDEDANIELIVDYNDIKDSTDGRLQVSIDKYPDRLKSLSLKNDKVEYTVVKN